MDRMHDRLRRRIEDPKVDAFLEEVLSVCRKHGMGIGHEDFHGGFIVEPLDDGLIEWLSAASIDMPHPDEPPPPKPTYEEKTDLVAAIQARIWPNGQK